MVHKVKNHFSLNHWKSISINYFGTFLFFLSAFVGLIKLLNQKVPGHYRIFTGAAHALWLGENPHGTTFGTEVGFWFYSPSCGLFFYKFFDLFPEKCGLILYSVFSVAAFYIGLNLFLKWMKNHFELKDLFKEIILFILAPFIHIGVTASKPEVVMTGILLYGVSLLKEGDQTDQSLQKKSSNQSSNNDSQKVLNQNLILSAFLLSMILNWKFQPLPSLGLLSLSWILVKRNVKFPIMLLCMTLFWFLIPLTVLSFEKLKEFMNSMQSTLNVFISEAYFSFDNVFSFVVRGLKINMSLFSTQVLSLGVGIILAGSIIFLWWKNKTVEKNEVENSNNEEKLIVTVHKEEDRQFFKLALFSLAFGSWFTSTLSPLSQNNATILLTPFFIFFLKESMESKIIKVLMVILVGVLFLSYSDLMPLVVRTFLREIGFKPLVVFSFGVFLLVKKLLNRDINCH